MISYFLSRVRARARSYGWRLTELDGFAGSLVRLEHDGATLLLGTGSLPSYPSNSAIGRAVARDKAYCHAVLTAGGYKSPASELLFLSNDFREQRPEGREITDWQTHAEQLGLPLVVKPNDGSMGRDIRFCADTDQVFDALTSLQGLGYHTALLQQQLSGVEWRLFIQSGEPVFCYRRLAAKAGGPANLHQGGAPVDFREEFSDSERQFARALSRDLGLDVCGVDLMGAEKEPLVDCHILEVNGNPALQSLERLGKHDLADQIIERSIETALAMAELTG